MKTVIEHEINVRTIIYNLINVYQPYPKLITEHKEAIDQALKEIEEVILESLPSHTARHRKVIERRMKWLKSQADSTRADISHTRAELSALEDAIRCFDTKANLLKKLGGKDV